MRRRLLLLTSAMMLSAFQHSYAETSCEALNAHSEWRADTNSYQVNLSVRTFSATSELTGSFLANTKAKGAFNCNFLASVGTGNANTQSACSKTDNSIRIFLYDLANPSSPDQSFCPPLSSESAILYTGTIKENTMYLATERHVPGQLREIRLVPVSRR